MGPHRRTKGEIFWVSGQWVQAGGVLLGRCKGSQRDQAPSLALQLLLKVPEAQHQGTDLHFPRASQNWRQPALGSSRILSLESSFLGPDPVVTPIPSSHLSLSPWVGLGRANTDSWVLAKCLVRKYLLSLPDQEQVPLLCSSGRSEGWDRI
jgi:hypothetical protein